jgi:hypothetical protein
VEVEVDRQMVEVEVVELVVTELLFQVEQN